jgi:Ca-activated chloride channel homolog
VVTLRWGIPLAVLFVALLAEWLHVRRCRRIGHLAFGPRGRARTWTAAVPWLRAASAAAVSWGLIVLWQIDASSGASLEAAAVTAPPHRVVIALDVSPSMQLMDAGPAGSQRRSIRARDVIRSIIERLDTRRTRFSLIAFFTGAKPIVVDATDVDVIDNLINDMPLGQAFEGGPTDMYAGIEAAAEIGRTWPLDTATLIFVSDGDSLPADEPPVLPASYSGALVLGVGNPYRGTFIDGHNSRQDGSALNRLAVRLQGHYNDVNTSHVPTAQLQELAARLPVVDESALGLREYALWAVVVGASVLALLPVALALLGSAWNPARAGPVPTKPLEGEPILTM